MAQYNYAQLSPNGLLKTFSYYRVSGIVFVYCSCYVLNTTLIHTIPFIFDMLMFVTDGEEERRNKFNPRIAYICFRKTKDFFRLLNTNTTAQLWLFTRRNEPTVLLLPFQEFVFLCLSVWAMYLCEH